MKLKDRVLLNLKERRERLLSGKINSIPSPLLRFKDDFVGVEQGRYYLVTAATKAGKSQFASFMFIYNTLLYAYAHPEQVNVKIFYYPLEETPENVMERFMSYLLYTLSEFKIRISPQDLKSTDNSKPLSEEILNILNSKEYGEILQFFEDSITFSYSTNATGVWKECKKYAEENGTVHTKPIIIKDDFGLTKEVNAFDYYESNNPNEYRIIFFDHLSLISTEKGMDLRQSMSKLSEYLVTLRNRYKFTPVVIQQQAMFENTDAFKLNKLTPSITNLADNKAIARDVDVCLSLFSPFRYEIPEYHGYNIRMLKDNVRFLEVLLNRSGQSNGVIALYFDGAVNYFEELPKSDDQIGLNKVYKQIQTRKSKSFLLITKYGKHLYDTGKKWFRKIYQY